MAKIVIRVDLEPGEELRLSHSTLELCEVVAIPCPIPSPEKKTIKINVESWETMKPEGTDKEEEIEDLDRWIGEDIEVEIKRQFPNG